MDKNAAEVGDYVQLVPSKGWKPVPCIIMNAGVSPNGDKWFDVTTPGGVYTENVTREDFIILMKAPKEGQ